jgi:predicted  nucleic acid-binding Zn-ribbon protein
MRLTIVHEVRFAESPATAEMLETLAFLRQKVTEMELKVQELIDSVSGLASVVDGAIAVLDTIKADLEAAKDDPVALQAAIDSIEANKAKLAAAIAANTPGQEPSTEEEPGA